MMFYVCAEEPHFFPISDCSRSLWWAFRAGHTGAWQVLTVPIWWESAPWLGLQHSPNLGHHWTAWFLVGVVAQLAVLLSHLPVDQGEGIGVSLNPFPAAAGGWVLGGRWDRGRGRGLRPWLWLPALRSWGALHLQGALRCISECWCTFQIPVRIPSESSGELVV